MSYRENVWVKAFCKEVQSLLLFTKSPEVFKELYISTLWNLAERFRSP